MAEQMYGESWADVLEQLERYSEPHAEILRALWLMTDLNDDLQHDRHPDCILNCINEVKAELDALLERAKAEHARWNP